MMWKDYGPLESAIWDIQFMADKQQDPYIKIVYQMCITICKDHLEKEKRLKALIDICIMALEEIVEGGTEPKIAAGGALLAFNQRESSEETLDWARNIIKNHKNKLENNE